MIRLNSAEVTYLVGGSDLSVTPLIPYDNLVCEFLEDLSQELSKNKKGRGYSDIITFAFWCRKANVNRLKKEFEDGKSRLGLGLVFHVAPSNVPINFAFSFAFGLLSGNANIVKIPSKAFPQVPIVCDALNRLLACEKYHGLRSMNALVKYDVKDEITAEVSLQCNARVIWGGDVTIRNIRKFPILERGVEIPFSDRYSFCLIDALSILMLDRQSLRRLAENFYTDTYLMDQNACSSPHLVVWQGEEKEKAKEIFWSAVVGVVSEKYGLGVEQALDKYTHLCHDAIEKDNIRSVKVHGNYVYRTTLDHLPDNTDSLRGSFGYFYEYDLKDLNSLARIINSKYQTLTYFGADRVELLNFVVHNRLMGIDRIVPIGRALEMDVIWDGCNVVKRLSRIIDVK